MNLERWLVERGISFVQTNSVYCNGIRGLSWYQVSVKLPKGGLDRLWGYKVPWLHLLLRRKIPLLQYLDPCQAWMTQYCPHSHSTLSVPCLWKGNACFNFKWHDVFVCGKIPFPGYSSESMIFYNREKKGKRLELFLNLYGFCDLV